MLCFARYVTVQQDILELCAETEADRGALESPSKGESKGPKPREVWQQVQRGGDKYQTLLENRQD